MASAPNNPRDTPAMRQYAKFKALYPDCLLLFRIGDFYELFDDDAVKASKALGLTLTQRTAGVPMAGMPYHQLELYLRRLVAQGIRVAVADQTQDAEEAKEAKEKGTGSGIIERAVTRVLTPGTLVDEALLADDKACTLGAVCFPAIDRVAPESVACVALVELSTGVFTVLAVPAAQLADELVRRGVSELLYPETGDGQAPGRISGVLRALGIAGTPQPQWHFRIAEAGESLRQQFGVTTLGGFDLAADDPLIPAAGAIIRYLRATQAPDADPAKSALRHLRPPKRHVSGEQLLLDAASLRALEIDRTLRSGSNPLDSSVAGSLMGVFCHSGSGRSLCRTSMGKRLLREWLVSPPSRLEAVLSRQRAVASLVEDRKLAAELAAAIDPVQDVARIAGRVALGRSTPRDLVALGKSLGQVGRVAEVIRDVPALASRRASVTAVAGVLEPIAAEIRRLCVDEPPGHLREGGLIRDGVDPALDEARMLKDRAGQWLAEYQAKLVGEHNLPSLKVGYNKVFGYFIELPKGQAQRAPAEFSRRQTLTNAERYITPELKEFEDKTTSASARALEREQLLFDQLCDRAAAVLEPISAFGQVIAELDVLLCFADKATARRWVKPSMVEHPVLDIAGGRHPVLDELLAGEFVPNDVRLGVRRDSTGTIAEQGESGPTLGLITGPNMAGKSTYIRQTALLVLLAHAGSFVPADSATIGICDRIFTRIGADDALHAGQSTFMVEMTETAGILNNATGSSLVILDEIGRGTSTLDGLSLAWAIAEDLATPRPERACPRSLFATHYHELTRLAEQLPQIVVNLQVAVREVGDQIIFLHRIIDGRADRSYGVHVARLAGVPARVVSRASELLETLSVQQEGVGQATTPGTSTVAGGSRGRAAALEVKPRRAKGDGQLALFTEYVSHPVVGELEKLKLDDLTPMKAFDELRRLRGLLEQ